MDISNNGAIPCVYLFEVGTVGNMRQHFNLENHLDNDDKVYKYGMTCDMSRRAGEHQKTYGKLKDNSFRLTVFSYIDETYVSKEKLVNLFMNVRVDDPNYNELVVIKNKNIAVIKGLYGDMYLCYSGNNSGFIQQIQEIQLDNQIKNKEYEHELLMKEHENELQRNKYEQSLKDKEHIHEIVLLKKDSDNQIKNKEHNNEIVLLKKDSEFLQLKHKIELQEVELLYLRKNLP